MADYQSTALWDTPAWKKTFGPGLGNPLTNSKGEYFPNLAPIGNKLQNAFLQSGVNTGKTGFNSGSTGYTPNTITRNLTVPAPIVNKNALPPRPKEFRLDSMPKTDNTVKKGTGKSLSKDKVSRPLPSLAPLETAATQVAPMAVQQDMVTPTNTMAPTGLTMDAILVDPSKYANSDFSNYGAGSLGTYGNSGGLGDYAQIPDGNGGTIGVDQSAYEAIQNPTIGSGGNSNWIGGLSNYETLQGAAGLGGLAMNAYGMFGSGGTMDVNKKNIELMNQQLANNKELMATRQARGRDISAAFGGSRTGLGV